MTTNSRLEWESPGNIREIVPMPQLYPYQPLFVMNPGPVKSFSVYPNPATNKLTVNVGEFIVEGMAVFDIQGRKVYADNDPYTGEKTINISFEKGVIF